MNHSNYLFILAGAVIGSLMAIYMGVDPTNVLPIFTAIMVGLVAAFVLKSKSEKESGGNRGASPIPVKRSLSEMRLPAEDSLPDFRDSEARAHKRFTLYGTYIQMAIAISILILFAIRDETLVGFAFTILGLILVVAFGTYSLGQAYDLEEGKDVDTRRSVLLLSILCAIQISAFLLVYL